MKRLLIVGLIASLFACSSEEQEAPTPDFGVFELPAHFPDPIYDFTDNPTTKEGFELGRKLFYDVRLSRGAQVSCGSCHAQVHAFADHSTPLSFGVDGRAGIRNSPGLYNLAWIEDFMWDGGINHIEIMPIAPITEPVEMDMPLADLIEYLQNETEYPAEFEKAFGTSEIDSRNLLLALTQFQGSIVSNRSRYDKYLQGDYVLTEQQKQGMEIFEAKCSSCHTGVLQTDGSFRNNGLDTVFTDLGRGRITQLDADHGKFRVPSLRNVALTNPYMHDGRFATLEQVLDHYSDGIKPSSTLDPVLSEGIPLNEEEKEAILEFLYTLSDFELLGDLRFSEPINE